MGVGCNLRRVGFDVGEEVQRVGVVGDAGVDDGVYWGGDGGDDRGRGLVEGGRMECNGIWVQSVAGLFVCAGDAVELRPEHCILLRVQETAAGHERRV